MAVKLFDEFFVIVTAQAAVHDFFRDPRPDGFKKRQRPVDGVLVTGLAGRVILGIGFRIALGIDWAVNALAEVVLDIGMGKIRPGALALNMTFNQAVDFFDAGMGYFFDIPVALGAF
jgi:hypothetical protein